MVNKPGKSTRQENFASSKRHVTSYDVALHAGVSQSAVSRCFKADASVSKKMRERVMKSVKELGYHPNAIARGLITRRSNMVAVIVSNLTTGTARWIRLKVEAMRRSDPGGLCGRLIQ